MDRIRRGARVVDWGGLENRCAFAGTVGSNPTLSAIPFIYRDGMPSSDSALPGFSLTVRRVGSGLDFGGGQFVSFSPEWLAGVQEI